MPRTKSSNQEIEKFVELFKRNQFLYDPSEKDHEEQQNVHSAWSSIAKIMDKEDVTVEINFNPAITHESELNGHMWYT